VTPNHPEYPGAHGSITRAEAEVLAQVLGTRRINVDLAGFNLASGLTDISRHFTRVSDLRREIIDARVWGGLHYRWSSIRGVVLGRKTARWALARFFEPIS
jgi:hypothetical protein